jgi:ParB family chromosome partitioning protein
MQGPDNASPSVASIDPTARRPVCSINVGAITVSPDRLRTLQPDVVDELAESITARSLLQPILVRRRGADYELVAGRHRLEAARKCGHQAIRAEIYDSLSDDDAELIQIDENLVRADLGFAERALHIGRRKELYEKLHPETKHGAIGRGREKNRQVGDSNDRFTRETAKKTRRSERQVQRDASRAKNVVVLTDIAGTTLDKGDEIDALAKLPEDEQRRLASAAKTGMKVSAKPQVKKVKRETKKKTKPETELPKMSQLGSGEVVTSPVNEFASSMEALQEFKAAADRLLPQMFPQDRAAAIAYVGAYNPEATKP